MYLCKEIKNIYQDEKVYYFIIYQLNSIKYFCTLRVCRSLLVWNIGRGATTSKPSLRNTKRLGVSCALQPHAK